MRLTLAVLICFCVGCANVQVTPLNPPAQTPPMRGPDEVTVYMTKAPERAYDEAYIIRSDAGNSRDALSAMRKRAGELGCDGLVISGSADRVVSTPDGRGNASVSMREGYIGSCIIFRTPAAPDVAPPAPAPAATEAPATSAPQPVLESLDGGVVPDNDAGEQPPS